VHRRPLPVMGAAQAASCGVPCQPTSAG
jgi:hypothetical protein